MKTMRLKNKLLAKATKKLVAQMKTDSVAGGLYTDEKNPFNDENLTEKFVWSKKIEKEGKKAVQNLTDKDAQLEREEEIKKIELRRIEYEKARAEREEERDQKMREKAMEGAEELEEKEEKFHFNQLLLRADIRYKNGRAKPIDTLLRALYGSAFTSALKSEKELAAMKAFNKEFDSKNSLFKYMTEKDLQELKDECVNVLKLIDETSEKEKEYKLFWTCVYRLTETELGEEEEEDKLTEMDEEMMESVDLSGSLEELTDLEQEINRSINEDLDDDTEISFWRKAMKRVTLAKLNRQCRETLAKVYEESKKNIKFVVVEKKDGKEEKENYDNDEDDEDLLGGDDFAKRVRDDDKDDDDGKEEEDEEEEEEEEEDEEALLANIDVTYGDEPKPLSKEESAKLLKLYEEQQQRLRGEGEDLLNVQEVIVLIDEDEDAENLRRLRAAACEKFAKEQLEKKLEKQRRYQQERMKRQKGRKINRATTKKKTKTKKKRKRQKKSNMKLPISRKNSKRSDTRRNRWANSRMGTSRSPAKSNKKISAIENFTGGTTSTNLGNLDTSTECTPGTSGTSTTPRITTTITRRRKPSKGISLTSSTRI